jgi:Na+/proline symporter
VCTIAWCVTAISGVAWYMQNGKALSEIDPDQLYGDLASHFLPRLLPGALGLFVASMLSGVMSSCNAFMLSSAALFTQNVYRPLVAGREEAHYLLVGRVASVMVVLGGILFAFWVPNVIKALEIWFMIAPMMGITLWLGLFWRPFTALGAWASTLAGFGTWWLSTQPAVITWVGGFSMATSWRLVWEENGKTSIYLPWQIVAYMSVAVVMGLVVSRLSKPVPKEQLDRFYRLIRTPVQPGEKILAPCTVPVESERFERVPIVSRYGLEIPRLSALSIQGFLVGWVCVILLILGFWSLWQF